MKPTAIPKDQFNRLATIAAMLGLVFFVATAKFRGENYEVPQVDLLQARELIDAGALVVDVRGAEAYGNRHLPGAVSMPVSRLREGIPLPLAAAKAKSVLVYCNDGARSGPEATHILQAAGFSKVVNMKSGIEGWAGAGLPIKKG